ncbi:MAG: bifunctional diaminohydroxyphosphoribosylaminopyrimidine deaminase/5-amino-6-(5-phosphoribosylamino)uracil reductase RibD [Deltaproteobacteria bacterium]|nr:bifunctional diaminohydroxyphosphoribosylaminopyrimidine deaminase/5-amino-6-(5-phosphoribosylamino)uracil reductase RibD [Deltaproteobacteria bacterium]
MPKTDVQYMRLALRLAARGAGWTSPNPMVGAAVVKNDRVVGKGYHRGYGLPHAEVEALRRAGDAARGADLYVTLEPCNHHGKTPPCTQAILEAGVRRVVVAVRDPNPRVNGGGAEFLASQGVQVEVGLLEAEARRVNEAWFKWMATGLPWVMAKAACSLDGRMATATGESQWLTGEAARAFGHRLRHLSDAILVGVNTVIADDPQLTTRLPTKDRRPKTEDRFKDPIRIILDSRLRLPLTARLLNLDSPAPTWVACTEAAPAEKRRALEKKGAEVLVLPEESGRVALQPLLALLGQRQVQSLLVEGGAEVLGSFFDQKLVDQFFFFYAPKFLGGRRALSVLGGEGAARLQDASQARDLSVRRLGPDLLLSGYLSPGQYLC